MSTFTEGDVYQTCFDPKAYLQGFCSFGSSRDALLNFRLEQYFQTFRSGGVVGRTLIDIGSGPSIFQFISACEVFDEIIASDYTDANRLELEKWLNNEPGSFDWSTVLKHACKLEGDRQKWHEKEEKIRKTVKCVLKCDVTKPHPLEPNVLPEVDCVVTSLCLEPACRDYETYCNALKNITSLLRTGGHLVMIGLLGDTFYTVGQSRFSCLKLDEELVRKAVVMAGYAIKSMELFPGAGNDHRDKLADYEAQFFMVAEKEKCV